ncbi:MAG: VWA domain-containing protein [Phycisphaerales bacterium]|nr:VWA domain-containing protein [Phycisphaerales bacterium]
MTLLTPIPALAAAAATIPVVIVLYLLKLRRRPVRISSTLLWEQAARDLQVNVPFRLLRPSLLLLLHLAILGMFLLALARPALDSGSAVPARVVLLIDRSASMAATSDGVSRLADAVERASVLVDNSLRSSQTEVGLIAFAAEPRIIAGFTRDAGSLRAALRGLDATDQPGDLAAALRLAGAMATAGTTGKDEHPPPFRVALFSDGDFDPQAPLTLAGGTLRFDRVGPGEADAAAIDNLGLVAIAARRDYDDPGLVRVLARIVNAGPAPIAVPVALLVDGRETDRRVVDVPARTPTGLGEAAASFSARTLSASVVTVRLQRPDQLIADNAASVVVEAAAAPRIVLVIPDPVESGPAMGQGPEWLLTDAITELHPRSFRVISRSTFDESGGGGADLVILDRVTPRAAPSAPTLSFGAGIPGVAGVAAPADERGTYVLSWERSHPVLRQVALDTVYVSRPLTLTPAGTPGTRTTELARGVSGPLIVLVEQGRTRRLVVLFALADSNWPLTVGFPVFLAQAVDFLAHRETGSGGTGAFTTSEPAEVALPPGTRRVRVDGPRTFDRGVPPGDTRVALGILDRAGVYRVQPDARDASPIPVAVNLASPRESSLATRDALQISGETIAAAAPGEGPREIWHWFVMAALGLLTLEWLLYAWQMRG